MIAPVKFIEINRKKFSEFNLLDDITDASKVFMVGYQQQPQQRRNVRVCLEDITGGGSEDKSTVLARLDPAASIEVDGYRRVVDGGLVIWNFDQKAIGAYLQISDVVDADMNEVEYKGESCLSLDICFSDMHLGENIRLYLPNFAGPRKQLLRFWRIDPKDALPSSVNEMPVVVLTTDPASGKDTQDWLARFVVLGHVAGDGLVLPYARTAEVLNIFDEAEGGIVE